MARGFGELRERLAPPRAPTVPLRAPVGPAGDARGTEGVRVQAAGRKLRAEPLPSAPASSGASRGTGAGWAALAARARELAAGAARRAWAEDLGERCAARAAERLLRAAAGGLDEVSKVQEELVALAAAATVGLVLGLSSNAPWRGRTLQSPAVVPKVITEARVEQLDGERIGELPDKVLLPAIPSQQAGVAILPPAMGLSIMEGLEGLREVARVGLQASSLGLGVLAQALPAVGLLLQGLALVLAPILQLGIRTAAGLLRFLAAKAPLLASSALPLGAAPEGGKLQELARLPDVLSGLGLALDALADAVPQIGAVVGYGTGKALPVVQATLTAGSEITADAATL